jgi:hypothetical protein
MRRALKLGAIALATALGLIAPAAAPANETDQFTVPVGQDFADLGPYFSQDLYNNLVEIVDDANKEIYEVLKNPNGFGGRSKLEKLYSGEYIAKQMYKKHGQGWAEADRIERTIKSDEFAKAFPGKLVAYRPSPWIYSGAHMPFDPRNAFLVARGSTIKMYGCYFGTDKIGHFHHLGYVYYKKAIRSDAPTVEEQSRWAVATGSKGLVSEGFLVGNLTAGTYSNADLCANYIGMKFYFNLTAPVTLQGAVHPPMLVRNGPYWQLNSHVTKGADVFKPFVSEHYNEALNPCVYAFTMRDNIADRVRKNAETVLTFYCDQQGKPRSKQYFDQKVRDLWTYWGEDYGHSDSEQNLVTIGATCFDSETSLAEARPSKAAAPLPGVVDASPAKQTPYGPVP